MHRAFAYESEPYRREITVRLLETGIGGDGAFAVVDDTVLYPGGGGQPRDRGTLSGVPVTSVSVGDDTVLLGLEGPVGGDAADLVLDWGLRYDRMQQHTAQHLLTAVAREAYGWETTSFHLGDEICDIELGTPSLPAEALDTLQTAVMDRIRAALPVRARRVSMDEYRTLDVRSRGLPEGFSGEVRLVEIEGLDVTTCGGTHVARTSELDTVCLLDTEAVRGGTRTRLRWLAGDRVRRRLLRHEHRSRELRQAMGVGDDELTEAIRLRGERLKRAERRIRYLESTFAEEVAARLVEGEGPLVHRHFDDVEPSFVQTVARTFAVGSAESVALLTSRGPKGLFLVVVGGEGFAGDVQALGRAVCDAMGGRGGGSGSIFQGKPASLDGLGEAIRQAASTLAQGS